MQKSKIALLGAMGEETHLLEAAIENKSVHSIAGRKFTCGDWHGVPVVTGFSKWGKVAAAISTTLAFDRFGVDEVLFLGVAGSFRPEVKCGDVVIAAHCLQYDMDVSALPDYEKWEVPLLKVQRFAAQPENVVRLQALAADYLQAHSPLLPLNVHVGLLGTGDSFVADSSKKRQLQSELPDLLAVDMESAAVAQVCYEFQRPFNIVRIISDAADDGAVFDFQQFIQVQAAPAVKEIASRFVQEKYSGKNP